MFLSGTFLVVLVSGFLSGSLLLPLSCPLFAPLLSPPLSLSFLLLLSHLSSIWDCFPPLPFWSLEGCSAADDSQVAPPSSSVRGRLIDLYSAGLEVSVRNAAQVEVAIAGKGLGPFL